MKPQLSTDIDHISDPGLWVLSARQEPVTRLHSHDHIELGALESGWVNSMIGGHWVHLKAHQLIVFWASPPHGAIELAPNTYVHVVHVPLAWFLEWRLPAEFTRRLLAGEPIVETQRSRPISDIAVVKDWIDLWKTGSAEARRIVLLEIEARLRRMALRFKPGRLASPARSGAPGPANAAGPLRHYARLAAYVAANYRESLSLARIAKAVCLHPVYAARVFRRIAGTTLLGALARHRVAHAQQLLATRDMKIADIALESGFGSIPRFYAVFQKMTRLTPRAYRRQARAS